MTSQRLTWNFGLAEYPAIAVDSASNVHVVWEDDTPGNREIYYKKSTNGGSTWMTSRRLTWNVHSYPNPAIAVDSSGNVHVVWNDQYGEIHYKKSTNGGATWITSQRITWTWGTSLWPAIAVDSSGNVHVVWSDDTPTFPHGGEVYYKKSTDGGSTWMTSQRICWTSGSSFKPSIALDSSGNLHVVWYDDTPGNYEIYYKKSTNGGLTWMTSQRLTWNSGWSGDPSIAVDTSGNVNVVWDDDTPGNGEIYYRKYIK